jgi:hypothetical protein
LTEYIDIYAKICTGEKERLREAVTHQIMKSNLPLSPTSRRGKKVNWHKIIMLCDVAYPICFYDLLFTPRIGSIVDLIYGNGSLGK